MNDDEIQKWLTDDERALFSHEMMEPLRCLARARKALFRTYIVADGMVTGSILVHAAKQEVKRWFDESTWASGFDTHQRIQDAIAELLREEHDRRRRPKT